MAEIIKLLRYNTGNDKKVFLQFKDSFDAVIFNASIVAHSRNAIADLVSVHMHKYIVDPQTYILQHDISAIANSKGVLKESVRKYFEQLPSFILDSISSGKNKFTIDEIRSNLSDEELKNELLMFHENDIAKVFPLLSLEERQRLYHIIDSEVLSEIISYLEEPELYLSEMNEEMVTDVFETMDTDDIIDVLEDLDDSQRSELIELLDDESLEELKLIESYEEDMIGSKMSTNYIAVEIGVSVKDTMKKVIEEAAINDNVSIIYFLENGKFYGAIELRDLIIARQNDDLRDIIKTSYPYLLDTDIVPEVLNDIKDYAIESIPVVDKDNNLIGVITSSDIVEAVEEEMVEDYAKLAGLSSEEDLDESIKKSIEKRIPWLLILLILGLSTSLLISKFETVVSSLPIIVFFQSLILGMSGNSGTQSLAVTIRLMSAEEIEKGDSIKIILKELRIGFINGIIVGLATFISVFLFLIVFEDLSDLENIKIAAVVGISMLGSMIVACVSGCLIPIIFKKCKIDPAVASGPFITTLNDVIAIIVYYGLAWLLLLGI